MLICIENLRLLRAAAAQLQEPWRGAENLALEKPRLGVPTSPAAEKCRAEPQTFKLRSRFPADGRQQTESHH